MRAGVVWLAARLLLVLDVAVAASWQFPVPNLQEQFKAYNPNYAEELANFTGALTVAYEKFAAIEAQHPSASTTCLIQRFTEAKMQVVSTANFRLGWTIMDEIEQQLATPPETWPVGDSQSPVDGGWGRCYHSFDWRLEATEGAVAALAEQGRLPAIPVTLLDQVNSPSLLLERLRSLVNVDILTSGVDTVVAANQVNSNLCRMIYRQQPSNYPWHPDLFRTLANYTLHEWRNRTSGYWGPTYAMADGRRLQVPDLSTTFHNTKYYAAFGIDVGLWNELAQTTVNLVLVPFPWGQYTREGLPFNHNLYDTAQLFMQAWPAASPTVRAAMSAQSKRFLNFSLTMVEASGDGSFPMTHYDESAQTAMYFGVGTLQLFGFFDAKACFWSQEDPSACLVGRSYEQRRVLYDQMAASAFRKLADSHGEGSDYIDALGKMGIVVPMPMRSGYNGSTNDTSPRPPSLAQPPNFEVGVAVGFGIACAAFALISGLLCACGRCQRKPRPGPRDPPAGSVQLRDP